jgi:hypothetical protein
MAGYFVTNLATPISNTDAANKGYIDDNFYLNTTTLNNITAPTGNLSLGNNRIISLATPVNAGDAVTKSYLDDGFYTNTTTLD